MINTQDRFWSEGQNYYGPSDNPSTKAYCNVWDWDQLRMIKIKGSAKLFPPEEDIELSILAQFADYLSLEIRAITVDDDGLLTGVSTDPAEDDTIFLAYPPFSMCESLADCRTVRYSELQELDRLGPFVDLLSYEDEFRIPQKDELNILKSLPPHPNIIPFDRVVLEDKESRVIGFTTKYIPGGTIDNPEIPFRFEWLQQLTQVVDFLNLELGIMHQDIAPRNLLIDPRTHKIVLFDFDRAASISEKKHLYRGRDDVVGVAFTLYEFVTNDASFSAIHHSDRNIDMVQSIEWTSNRELDSEPSEFRNFLNEWVAQRSIKDIEQCFGNAPHQLTWPDLPTAPDYSVPFEMGTFCGKPQWITGIRSRRTAMDLGQYCFRWERPPQSRLSKKKLKPRASLGHTHPAPKHKESHYAIMDLPGLDETGFMIDSCIRAETANQDDFQKFVSQYLGQIIKGLRLPWSVTSKDKMMDEGTRYSREVFVTASGITVLWGEISHSKTIDQMRLDLVARVRLQATHTNRHFAFAFASSNKDQYVEIECLRIDPD